MAKVGSIKTYHNGSAYSMADIYDSQLIVNNYPTENVDSDTYILYRANSSGDFIEEYNNAAQVQNPSYAATELLTVNNKDSYFMHVSNTARVSCTIDTDTGIADKITADGYTVDGVFYYPQNKYNRKQRLIEFSYFPININSYSSASVQCGVSYSSSLTKSATIDNSIFAAPFHFAFTHNTSNTIKLYFNGVAKLTLTASRSLGNNILNIGNKAGGDAFDISCAFLRFRTGVHWTDNFTFNPSTALYGFDKPYCVNIRHNNQTYYAPLVTTKQAPCLCVRHNNQNYYTVNS